MELARRRRMERRKAAEKRARQALLAALGLMPLKKPKKRKKKKTTGGKSKKREAAPGVGQGPASTATEPGAELAAQGNQGQGKRPKPITREDILKLAIADELGYLDTVRADGWGGLSTAQSGRVGGTMTRRMKRLERESPPS